MQQWKMTTKYSIIYIAYLYIEASVMVFIVLLSEFVLLISWTMAYCVCICLCVLCVMKTAQPNTEKKKASKIHNNYSLHWSR